MYSIATWRMSILRNFSHFPLLGPGWGIFSRSLSKPVLISPCRWRSRAFASFRRYLRTTNMTLRKNTNYALDIDLREIETSSLEETLKYLQRRKVSEKVRRRFYWSKVQVLCQKNKPPAHPSTSQPWLWPPLPWPSLIITLTLLDASQLVLAPKKNWSDPNLIFKKFRSYSLHISFFLHFL